MSRSGNAPRRRKFAILLPIEGLYGDMGKALADALMAAEVEVGFVGVPGISPPMVQQIDMDNLHQVLDQFEPTDIFTINIPRSAVKIPDAVTYHVWMQDPHDWRFGNSVLGDKVWTYLYRWVFQYGLSVFFPPATNYGQYLPDTHNNEYDADVAFAGGLPWLWAIVKSHPEHGEEIVRLTAAIEARLAQTKCYIGDWTMCSSLLHWAELKTGIFIPPGEFRDMMIQHVLVRLVRHFPRMELANFLKDVCERRNWRLRIVGSNWDTYQHLRQYTSPQIEAGADLARFYQRSKVNLHMNGDTNFHGRVLESVACGGFMLAASHMTDDNPGGIRTVLSPELLPTYCNFEDLEDKLAYYIEHDGQRKEAASEAGKIIRRDHSYDARVKLLLADQVAATAGAAE